MKDIRLRDYLWRIVVGFDNIATIEDLRKDMPLKGKRHCRRVGHARTNSANDRKKPYEKRPDYVKSVERVNQRTADLNKMSRASSSGGFYR